MSEAAISRDEELWILGEAPGYCVAIFRNVLIMLIAGEIDRSFLRLSLLGHHKVVEYDPEGYGLVTIVASGSRLPDSELRTEASELRKKTQHLLRAQGIVIGGEGFFASTMRAVLTGIFAMAQSRVPTKMVGEIQEACQFVSEKIGLDAETAKALEDALITLKEGRA